ncbi:hypothetical protein [Paraburkholderia sp. GAS32]|uniref:hypothetical protein n=1 Tax=Paraburkholderia sp. GAS32 TaxID=3035129 RepID=UPI003D1E015B
MSQAAQILAAARANLVTATERAEAAHAAQSKLLVRKSECEAAAATALADFRAGKIDEATASLRKASADADAKDIAGLIDQGAAHLATLNRDVIARKGDAAQAENEFKREEWTIETAVLDRQIAQLEATFLAAMAERYRLHMQINGSRGSQSTFGFYEPSRAMKELITRNVPPSV